MSEAEALEIEHPRERHSLVGHAEATQALRDAEEGGRLHHAWLLGGPAGIGKATLAYRFARWLLAPPAERETGTDGLGVDPASRTARQIVAGAHPNLVVLERLPATGDKAAPRTIGVEAVRKAFGFFSTTAAGEGRRVCIIDSVDDLTTQAANALLKTVEEPPPRSLILLVSHSPQRVLPTIRSRCRRLILSPLRTEQVGEVLRTLGPGEGPADDEALARAAAASDGSVARALALLEPRRLALLQELTSLLDELPDLPVGRVLGLAERVSARGDEEGFSLAVDAMLRWVAARVNDRQHLGAARLAPLAELCENISEAAGDVEVYNLDRRAFIVSTFGDLAEAVRRAA